MKVSNYMVLIYCVTVQTFDLPKQINKVCDRDDPDLDDCLKEAAQIILKSLENGIPEYGMDPIDPYYEKELIVEYKQNQIYGKILVNDLVCTGLSKAKVHAVRSNLQDDFMKMELDMTNEVVKVAFEFDGEGRLSALVVKTQKAFIDLTMYGVTWTWKIYGEPYMKNNATHMKIKKFVMRPQVKNLDVKFKNFVLGDSSIASYVEEFAQDNWKLVYNELLPVIVKIWHKEGVKASNKIFSKIPYDVLFPTSD